ncbi:MAG TPA: FAD-dependent oxidoreductase [Dokdonella sp.]
MSEKTFPFLRFHRELPREVPVQVRVLGFGEIHGGFADGDAADQAARCIDCGNPYCSWGCPLGNRIPQWLKLARDGRIEDAAALMHETNPLPEICGRVCPQDRLCEGVCTLESEDFGAVTIGAVERWVTDEALRRGWRPHAAAEASGQRAAIVGAGPAGLAAADRLIRAGVAVDVYDRYEEIGGLLTFGIPPFKLDKAVVLTRRRVLEEFGVKFHLGVEVGAGIAFERLLAGYGAVFLGTGAYRYVDGGLPGQALPGVLPALPYLVANARRLLGSGAADALPDLAGRRVVVLGGGDTAMDCNRTSIRLGAAQVSCVYRRDEANMPGSRREVKYAKDEGVRFLFNRQPLAILAGEDGRVRAVRVAETRLVDDGSGRARPELVPDSEAEIPADVVILAFGFLPSPADWCATAGIALDASGRMVTGGDGRLPGQTTNPKVFAGGDVVRGADLVVRAVLDGREAAKSMLALLGVTAPAPSEVSF